MSLQGKKNHQWCSLALLRMLFFSSPNTKAGPVNIFLSVQKNLRCTFQAQTIEGCDSLLSHSDLCRASNTQSAFLSFFFSFFFWDEQSLCFIVFQKGVLEHHYWALEAAVSLPCNLHPSRNIPWSHSVGEMHSPAIAHTTFQHQPATASHSLPDVSAGAPGDKGILQHDFFPPSVLSPTLYLFFPALA